jgi:hypothetical protein
VSASVPTPAPRRVLAALLVMAVAACGGETSSAPEPPSLTGSWSGTVQETGQAYTLSLTQSATRVSGTGTVLDSEGMATTAVVGNTQGFTVALEISYPNTGFNPVVFTGSFASRDEMRGGLKFSRRPLPDSITFRRQ